MKVVGIHEAKTSLSRLIKAACMGEEIIIARGKVPVVRLVPVPARKGRRKLGILKGKLVVGAEFFEPFPPEELAQVPSVPDSLSGAIAALGADHSFLLKGDVFNADFVANWIEMKQKEYDALRLRPHPYEFAMYYDV